jgi:hypothetical protein
MFRQTFIKACLKREINAGATNCWNSEDVLITLDGPEKIIFELLERLNSNSAINSWNATPIETIELEEVIPVNELEVTCTNVNDFSWTPGVKMYL